MLGHDRRVDLVRPSAEGRLEALETSVELDSPIAGFRELVVRRLNVTGDEILPVLHRNRQDVMPLLEVMQRELGLLELFTKGRELVFQPILGAICRLESVFDRLRNV